MTLEVLYEDNHVIVCYKPAGILSQADNTGDIDMLTLIKDYLKKQLGDTPISIMQGIKKVFDEKNILNPEKICF